jgi:CheY-like chemotaxis protein
MLEVLGYAVSFAESGDEAVSKYVSWLPDVVLLDRNLPGMDGFACAEKIVKKDRNAQIVIMSGYDEPSFYGIESTIRDAIKGYLTKPFSITELNQVLEALFRSSQP